MTTRPNCVGWTLRSSLIALRVRHPALGEALASVRRRFKASAANVAAGVVVTPVTTETKCHEALASVGIDVVSVIAVEDGLYGDLEVLTSHRDPSYVLLVEHHVDVP